MNGPDPDHGSIATEGSIVPADLINADDGSDLADEKPVGNEPLPKEAVGEKEDGNDAKAEGKSGKKRGGKSKGSADSGDDAGDEGRKPSGNDDDRRSAKIGKGKASSGGADKPGSDDSVSDGGDNDADDDTESGEDDDKPPPKKDEKNEEEEKPKYKGWSETQVRRGFQKLKSDVREFKAERDRIKAEHDELTGPLKSDDPKQKLNWMMKNRVNMEELAQIWMDAKEKGEIDENKPFPDDPKVAEQKKFEQIEASYVNAAMTHLRAGMDHEKYPLLSKYPRKELAKSYFQFALKHYERTGDEPTYDEAWEAMEKRYRSVAERELDEYAEALGYKIVRDWNGVKAEPEPAKPKKPKLAAVEKPKEPEKDPDDEDDDEEETDEIVTDPVTGKVVHRLDEEAWRLAKSRIASKKSRKRKSA